MFCPNCKYEYRLGVTVCPDCGATLVYKLPPEFKDEKPAPVLLELVTVFESADRSLIAVAKEILDEAGIEYYAKNENLIRRYTRMVGIQVFENRVAEAQALLKDLETSQILPEDHSFDDDKEP
jgi:hypothetical protein